MADRVVVRDNTSESRYEIFVDGTRAGVILYRRRPAAVALIHTEIDPQFEGHGLGGRLVEGVLDDIRTQSLRVVPICPFVQSYLDRHPELGDLDARHSEVAN